MDNRHKRCLMRKNPRKIKRIILYRRKNPTLTLAQIGKRFKCSREYIHHVLKSNNEPTLRAIPKKVTPCINCNTLIEKGIRFCSNKCRFNYYNIKVTCTLCRVPFYRKRYQIIQRYYDLRGYKHIYCSRQCFYRGQRAGISSKKNLI